MSEPLVPPITDWQGIQLKGPLSLTTWKICPQCSDWIQPGHGAYLLEEAGMLDDYIHIDCAPCDQRFQEEAP